MLRYNVAPPSLLSDWNNMNIRQNLFKKAENSGTRERNDKT